MFIYVCVCGGSWPKKKEGAFMSFCEIIEQNIREEYFGDE